MYKYHSFSHRNYRLKHARKVPYAAVLPRTLSFVLLFSYFSVFQTVIAMGKWMIFIHKIMLNSLYTFLVLEKKKKNMDFKGLTILFWPLTWDNRYSRGNHACIFVWRLSLHWKTVQFGVILYTLIALSKQEPAPLTKPVSDNGDRS